MDYKEKKKANMPDRRNKLAPNYGVERFGFPLRIFETLNLLFWGSLIFSKIAIDPDRFLYLLVFGLHFAVSLSTFEFVHEQSKSKRRGIWFYLILITFGVIADVASLVEHVVHFEHDGFTKIATAETVLWSYTVLIDLAYIAWAAAAYTARRNR